MKTFKKKTEDDPLTDEEQENKSSDVSLENRSIALRSGDESSEILDSRIDVKNRNGVLVNSNEKKSVQDLNKMSLPFKKEKVYDFDSITGWR